MEEEVGQDGLENCYLWVVLDKREESSDFVVAIGTRA
jgi:hypothetical protein